jgi:hypothetical protein
LQKRATYADIDAVTTWQTFRHILRRYILLHCRASRRDTPLPGRCHIAGTRYLYDSSSQTADYAAIFAIEE